MPLPSFLTVFSTSRYSSLYSTTNRPPITLQTVNGTPVPRKLRETNQRRNVPGFRSFSLSLCSSLIPFKLRPTGMHLSSNIAVIIVSLLRRSAIFARSKNLILAKVIPRQTGIKLLLHECAYEISRYIVTCKTIYFENISFTHK